MSSVGPDISINSDAVRRFFSNIRDWLDGNPTLMDEVGAYASAKILERTAAGKDWEGAPFRPYSKSWAQFRKEHGRSTNVVNLFFYGNMLGALTYRVDSKGLQTKLFFASAEEAQKAQENEALGRKFFAINDEDKQHIMKMVRTSLNKAVGR